MSWIAVWLNQGVRMVVDSGLLEKARGDRRSLFNFERLQVGMQQAGLEAVVALSNANVTYSGGAYIRGDPAVLAAITTIDGRQTLVLTEADAYFFREYSWIK